MQNGLEALNAAVAAAIADHPKPLSIPPLNSKAEYEFYRLIQTQGGFPVFNRGWPDCAVFGRDERLKAVVEVKPQKGHSRFRPEADQMVMLTGLASFGVPCFIWCPAGLVKINKDGTHQPVSMDVLTGML
jgi:hypothetical protein